MSVSSRDIIGQQAGSPSVRQVALRSGSPADARAEAAQKAEALELRRQELVGQRARLDEEIARVTAERRRWDVVAYAACQLRPCPDCGKPMAGAEQTWQGGYWAFATYCVSCRLAAQGLTEAEFEATA